MNPSDLYSNALSTLTAARTAMLSPEWQAALDQASAADRLAASRELIQVQQAILALSNATLTEIASAMQGNEQGLTQATEALKGALSKLVEVQNVIQAVTGVLNVVAKIVPLM